MCVSVCLCVCVSVCVCVCVQSADVRFADPQLISAARNEHRYFHYTSKM